MADFTPTQMEVQNTIDPEQNSVTIVDGTTPSYKASVNSLGQLSVVVSGGGSAGLLVLDNQIAALGADVGRIIVGYDGTNYQFISVNASGELKIGSIPNVTLASQANPFTSAIPVSGTFWQATQPVSGTFWPAVQPVDDNGGSITVDGSVSVGNFPATYDVSDRAGRLLGIIYGSQGQQLKQTATNYNLQVELATDGTLYDARQIRALTAADIVTVQQGTNPWVVRVGHSTDSVKVGDGTDFLAINTDGSALVDMTDDYTRQLGKVKLVDRNGYALDLEDDAVLPANYGVLLIAGHDLLDNVRSPTVSIDPSDSKHRLEIQGKVSMTPPTPPPATTPRTIFAASPLVVASSETTNYVIPNGVTFHILQVVVGAEGDPNERGSKVELYYVDSGSVLHLIDRLYLAGFTEFGDYPDTAEARDGTALTGNGTTTQIRIIRSRLGGSSCEIDAVIRGYEV